MATYRSVPAQRVLDAVSGKSLNNSTKKFFKSCVNSRGNVDSEAFKACVGMTAKSIDTMYNMIGVVMLGVDVKRSSGDAQKKIDLKNILSQSKLTLYKFLKLVYAGNGQKIGAYVDGASGKWFGELVINLFDKPLWDKFHKKIKSIKMASKPKRALFSNRLEKLKKLMTYFCPGSDRIWDKKQSEAYSRESKVSDREKANELAILKYLVSMRSEDGKKIPSEYRKRLVVHVYRRDNPIWDKLFKDIGDADPIWDNGSDFKGTIGENAFYFHGASFKLTANATDGRPIRFVLRKGSRLDEEELQAIAKAIFGEFNNCGLLEISSSEKSKYVDQVKEILRLKYRKEADLDIQIFLDGRSAYEKGYRKETKEAFILERPASGNKRQIALIEEKIDEFDPEVWAQKIANIIGKGENISGEELTEQILAELEKQGVSTRIINKLNIKVFSNESDYQHAGYQTKTPETQEAEFGLQDTIGQQHNNKNNIGIVHAQNSGSKAENLAKSIIGLFELKKTIVDSFREGARTKIDAARSKVAKNSEKLRNLHLFKKNKKQGNPENDESSASAPMRQDQYLFLDIDDNGGTKSKEQLRWERKKLEGLIAVGHLENNLRDALGKLQQESLAKTGAFTKIEIHLGVADEKQSNPDFENDNHHLKIWCDDTNGTNEENLVVKTLKIYCSRLLTTRSAAKYIENFIQDSARSWLNLPPPDSQ